MCDVRGVSVCIHFDRSQIPVHCLSEANIRTASDLGTVYPATSHESGERVVIERCTDFVDLWFVDFDFGVAVWCDVNVLFTGCCYDARSFDESYGRSTHNTIHRGLNQSQISACGEATAQFIPTAAARCHQTSRGRRCR